MVFVPIPPGVTAGGEPLGLMGPPAFQPTPPAIPPAIRPMPPAIPRTEGAEGGAPEPEEEEEEGTANFPLAPKKITLY